MNTPSFNSYLVLTERELKQFERELAEFTPSERSDTMEIMTSWHRQGLAEGLIQGKETLLLCLLHRRIGTVSSDLTSRMDRLSPEQLDDLGEALLDFTAVSDLDQWLAKFEQRTDSRPVDSMRKHH